MAYKSSFLGTFDQASNTSKSGSYTSPFTGTFASKKKREEDAAANKDYAAELKKEEQKKAADAQKKKEGSKSLFDRVGDVAKGVGNFAKEAIVDPAANAYTGIKDVVEGNQAANSSGKISEARLQLTRDTNQKLQEALGKEYNNPKSKKWASPEIKKIINEGNTALKTFDSQNAATVKENQKQFNESQKVDARKTAVGAAETFLNVATLGVGTGAKAGATAAIKGGTALAEQGAKEVTKTAAKKAFETVVGQGAKGLAKEAGKDAVIGGAYGALQTAENKDSGLDDYGRNILIGAALGAGAPVALKGAGKVVRAGDKKAGQVVADIADKTKIGAENEAVQRSLKQIGEDGIMGTLNKSLNRTGSALSYKASDLASKTKVGAKVIDLKDDFMSKWVTEFHPLYKSLKRSDFEGKTQGAYLAAREAIGNSNRALSYAQDFVETNPNMQKLTASIAASDKDLVKGRANFDEFAKLKSELDLVASVKKQFSKSKMKDLNTRMEKFKAGGAHEQQYEHLVGFYKDLNDFRLKEGLISKEQHAAFKNEGFDYVRQQRELPQWMMDKPAAKGRGSSASITKSEAVQKRSKYASAELLSPTETAIKTAQLAHVEAYRNQAAKTVVDLLEQGGGAKLVKTTAMVDEKRALLKGLKETKPLVTKLNRTIRTHQTQVRDLKKEIGWINRQGKNELSKQIKAVLKDLNEKAGKNKNGLVSNRQMMDALVSIDSVELRKLRKMVEGRNSKLGPLFDRIESLNGELSDIHAARKGMWQDANAIKTTVNKSNQTTMSFLDDGVENVAKIDPVIASAVHNWDKQSQNVMNEVLRFSNNVFKYGTTGANVGFALPNFVADQLGSAINSKSLMATHNPVNFVHSLFMALGKPLNAEDSKILQGYIKGNKGQLSINQYTKKGAADKVANKLTKQGANWGSKTYTVIRHPKEGMRALFDATEGAVGLTENLTRIQNYRGTARKATKEGLQGAEKLANQAARENSVDFLEMGSYGRVINSLIPYFNASIQGSRVMLRNASERPASFAAKTTALIGVPTAATTAWNTETKERKAIYDTIPQYLKDTNFIVITPGAKWNADKKKWDGVWMMKKPPGFKAFTDPVQKFIEYKADNPDSGLSDFIKDQGGSIATDFAGQVQPIDFSSPNKFLSSVTPQLLKPTAEAILNKNFFQGTDLVPSYLQSNEPKDQKYEHYSQLTSHIAAMFNTSPLKVDSWLKETFGEVGTNAVHYADRISGAAPEATGGRSLPESVGRRFYGAQGGADSTAFYDAYSPASNSRKTASSKITELVKAGRINEAKRRAEEYNQTIKDRFEPFIKKYADSPNYDPKWDTRINDLYIPTSNQAFKARSKQK